MEQQKKERDLAYLGDDFQRRLVHAFMEDKDFFKDISNIVDQNMFTNTVVKAYVSLLKNYLEKQSVVPSYTMMSIVINDKVRNEVDKASLIEFNLELQSETFEGIDYIKETASRFFKQQQIVKVAQQILEVANLGKADEYDECARLLNEAINVGFQNDQGENVFHNIEETLSDDYRVAIPTGISAIDEVLEGGIGKGELGVIIAPSGTGKTTLTTSMAAHAAEQGFKVLQIVFEDRVKQIQRKHIGRITNVEARNLSKESFKDQVINMVETYSNKEKLEKNLRIVRFRTGEITASYIEHYINRLTNGGFKPDLVIIDYFECLNHTGERTMAEWEKEGRTMRKFEAMAGEMDIAFWIPTQGNRDSIASEIVTMDKAGGSLKKIQIAHIILSIARSTEDIANNKATMAILKNRAGLSGKVWTGVSFNNGTCRVDTSTAQEEGGGLTFSEFEQKKDKEIKTIAKEMLRNYKQSQNF